MLQAEEMEDAETVAELLYGRDGSASRGGGRFPAAIVSSLGSKPKIFRGCRWNRPAKRRICNKAESKIK